MVTVVGVATFVVDRAVAEPVVADGALARAAGWQPPSSRSELADDLCALGLVFLVRQQALLVQAGQFL